MKTLALLVLVFSCSALAGHPTRLDEYDRLVGTFDYLHPERFEMSKVNHNAPKAWTRLFTPEEYAVASANHTIAYEAAVRMGLYSENVQRQMGIIRIEGDNGLTIHTRDTYGTWKFFLTDGMFEHDIIQLVSMNQDNYELAKMTQIHLTNGHSAHLKKGVDMWLFLKTKITNEYTHRSTETENTQVKIMRIDLRDPRGLYESRIEEAEAYKAEAGKKLRSKVLASPKMKTANTCEALF